MSENKPYYAPQPKQFPQRAPNHNPTKAPQTTTDPDHQLICPCGCELFDQGFAIYKIPGQVIGTVDLTWAQCFICRDCNLPLNVKDTKTRRETRLEEQKEGA